MIHSIFLISVDKDLSKLNPALFSQQSRMEISFDGVRNKADFTDEDGNYVDLKLWTGIDFNEDDDVTIIQLNLEEENSDFALQGTLTLRIFPKQSPSFT